MNNNVTLICETLVIFTLVLVSFKLFRKEGLYIWVAIAAILANIMTLKNANILGLNSTCGAVLFASIFLATDIISEHYSKEDAKKAVNIAIFANIVLIVSSQICIKYIPSSIDFANGYITGLFSINLRVTLASIVCMYIANILDVYLFDRLKRACNNKHLWLRNNVSTMLCNCGENFMFICMAYIGIYSMTNIISIATSICIIEAIIALIDTPFLYISKKISG